MNIITEMQLEGEMESSSRLAEKCVKIKDIFSQHNITESDYELIYNLTGREVSRLLENDNQHEIISCYCNQFRNFSLVYRQYHGYISFFVCIFGVISNILNIIVLTRREMVILPINRILRGLAMTDIVLMIEYIPFIFFYYFRIFPNFLNSYPGAVFIWLHVNFTQIMHTISIFMTLMLALWRYSAIRYPQRNVSISSNEKCNRCMVVAYLLPFIFCMPAYLIFTIQEKSLIENGVEEKIYVLDFSKLALANNEWFFYIYFWLYFILIKLVPCFILTVVTWWLIRTLKRASERRKELKLKNLDQNNYENTSLYVDSNFNRQKKYRRIDRTTNILIAVLSLFILTELPQGILGLMSVILGKQFFKTCYVSLGDAMDALALINGAVDFILYCTMSKQFRKTFGELFKPKILSNLMQTQEMEMVTTNV